MSSFLEKYKRQPKIYIDLPSQGTFYSPEVLEDQKFTSLPVFGMSAMDEIMFKTPDALFSGEATAQVIRSCIPSILDPWSIVGYDLDYLLISIRIATYGDTIPVSTSCPKCDEQTQNEINLSGLLANFANHGVKESFDINELTFNLKPITYKASTDFSVQRYHIDRAIAQLENQDVSYEEKQKELNQLLFDITKLNLQVATAHVESIQTTEDVEDEENIELDPDAIVDFISNNDSEFYTKLQDGITALTEKWNLPAFDITCASEECNHTYKTTLDLDYSSFFGLRSSHSRSLRS
jgi:hypothetical protein|tara:strand:+ start:3150 stop:4031 length:882 start_codon:yes stop_codon:yes gene_type:complete